MSLEVMKNNDLTFLPRLAKTRDIATNALETAVAQCCRCWFCWDELSNTPLQHHVVFVQMWVTVRSFYILSDYTVFEPCVSWEATPTLGSPLSWTLSPMPMWMSSRARGSVNFYNVWNNVWNNVWLTVMVVTNPSRNFKKFEWGWLEEALHTQHS